MRKTKSPILDAVHDTAKGLHKAGVMDQIMLREFDQLCLQPPVPWEVGTDHLELRGDAVEAGRVCQEAVNRHFKSTGKEDKSAEADHDGTQAPQSRTRARL